MIFDNISVFELKVTLQKITASLIDSQCLWWDSLCNDDRGACRAFDKTGMRIRIVFYKKVSKIYESFCKDMGRIWGKDKKKNWSPCFIALFLTPETPSYFHSKLKNNLCRKHSNSFVTVILSLKLACVIFYSVSIKYVDDVDHLNDEEKKK